MNFILQTLEFASLGQEPRLAMTGIYKLDKQQ